MESAGSRVAVRPLTPERWDDLEALFGPGGAHDHAGQSRQQDGQHQGEHRLAGREADLDNVLLPAELTRVGTREASAKARDLAYQQVLGLVGNLLGNGLSGSSLDVYSPTVLIPLGLAGVLVAVIAGLLPARWAASASVVDVLRSE